MPSNPVARVLLIKQPFRSRLTLARIEAAAMAGTWLSPLTTAALGTSQYRATIAINHRQFGVTLKPSTALLASMVVQNIHSSISSTPPGQYTRLRAFLQISSKSFSARSVSFSSR